MSYSFETSPVQNDSIRSVVPLSGSRHEAASSALLVETVRHFLTNTGDDGRGGLALTILSALPLADASTAARAAQTILLENAMTPLLAEAFVRRGDDSALMVLSECSALPSGTVSRLAQSGTLPEARALAARVDLDSRVLDRLIGRNDRVIDVLLAENLGTRLSGSVLAVLVARALDDRDLARCLIERPDLDPSVRAALFANAAHDQRERILADAAERARALSTTQDSVLQDEPAGALHAALGGALERGSHADFTRRLASALGFPEERLAATIIEPSGGPLALALRAVAAPDPLIRLACRLWRRPAGGSPLGFARIDDILEQATPRSARWVMDTIRLAMRAPTTAEAAEGLLQRIRA